ncbi:MAG: 16S rRNA (adenine(1518)-N(6)/adenine(1519)-N(6))-dimethyltransferase RsmA [Gemmatimonadota bacterium]|nr:16S rRNA (adenine(1518)-N(6)/adenine(1519)-N(6))-dimethyltransferase RsmA [Gemmatimonadota bacterium]
MGRRLGQHFLRDPRILDRIVDALDPLADDVVLEIGPGDGSLTRRLAPRVARVVAIERDRELVGQLTGAGHGERSAPLPGNVSVVGADALEIDWTGAEPLPAPGTSFKLVGNIPYYITSPLIAKALSPPLPAVVVFLVQKEVAERVVATPGGREYGALTVGVQAVARAERVFAIKAGAFQPPPKVDSALLRLTPLAEPLVSPTEFPALRRFLAALFGQRRKQLGRSLRHVVSLSAADAAALCGRLEIPPSVRPEQVAPDRLVALFRAAMR